MPPEEVNANYLAQVSELANKIDSMMMDNFRIDQVAGLLAGAKESLKLAKELLNKHDESIARDFQFEDAIDEINSMIIDLQDYRSSSYDIAQEAINSK